MKARYKILITEKEYSIKFDAKYCRMHLRKMQDHKGFNSLVDIVVKEMNSSKRVECPACIADRG